MGNRFGIVALTVAALIAAGPASAQLSAQLSAKPAVGTVMGVQSAMMPALQGDEMSEGWIEFNPVYSFVVGGVIVGGVIASTYNSRSNPASP